ncbi:MAG TPA: amidohydrolase [Firmicutes bacterium]|nr:amidohydrolase [Bacillota bacterium]
MNLLERAQQLKDEFIAYRRDFHQHPELGFEEERTSGIVAEYLESLGIEVTRVAKTGVVGLLRGGKPGRTMALRADMDALSIPQQNDVPYKSIHPGKMHACGHDGHTAILMGVAKLLSEVKDEIAGNVKFFFQPAEEGPGGALPMVEAGVMENPHVDAVMGLHLGTNLPTGKVGLKAGPSSAGTDSIKITLEGKGGHGAHPHTSIDTIVAAGHLIVAMQTIVSREIDPLGSAVVTLGTINGGYRNNVIAHQVELTGTVRTLDPEVRAAMPERIERIIKGVCETFRCKYEFVYDKGYPSVINDPAMADLAEAAAQRLLGAENVVRTANPSMGGEDFAYFAEKAPGIFLRLGAANPEKDCIYPGHHPYYNFDEDAIPIGMAVLAEATLDFLKQ